MVLDSNVAIEYVAVDTVAGAGDIAGVGVGAGAGVKAGAEVGDGAESRACIPSVGWIP